MEDVLVQLCPSVQCGGKSCYGLASAGDIAARHVVSCYGSFLDRPRRDGGGGFRPLSPSARPRANAVVHSFDRHSAVILFPPTRTHAPLKIDNGGKSIQERCVSTTMPLGAVRCGAGASHVTDSLPHAMPRHAASSPAMARSWLGLAGKGEGGSDRSPPRLGLALTR